MDVQIEAYVWACAICYLYQHVPLFFHSVFWLFRLIISTGTPKRAELRTWKRGTLRTILIRAFKTCSSEELLQNELKQIEEEFININDYPKWVFDQVNEEECKVMATMLQGIMKA